MVKIAIVGLIVMMFDVIAVVGGHYGLVDMMDVYGMNVMM